MKFTYKIIATCLITIAVIFSLGSALVIYQNHAHLLKSVIEQAAGSQSIESFSLESKLLQDTLEENTQYGSDVSAMDVRAQYYMLQYASIYTDKERYYLLKRDNQAVYMNIPNTLEASSQIENDASVRLMKDNKHYYAYLTTELKAGSLTYYLTTYTDITSVYQERNRQLQQFLIVNAGMLIIAFLLLNVSIRYLTRYIGLLNEASKRIAKGHYEERTQISSDDEIGELSKSFDEMAAATQQTFQKLKTEAEEKEEFMSSFSHEIKTPMTSIIGYADMLRTYDCDEATRQVAASYIFREGNRLNALSHTMMDLFALNQQTPKLSAIPVEQVMITLKQYYENSTNHANLAFCYDSGTVLSNEELLFTLLRNLIDNAVQVSEGTKVLIKGIHLDNTYQLMVIDHGIGMSQENIEKATLPFYMADKSRSRSKGGAGLGLSIVKKICDLHHTPLTIQSKENEGTTISFVLEVIKDEA